jgi:rhamnulose-1-phosphate aldolase
MIINREITEEINKVSEIAGYLWERGWSERNAGNLSLNLTDLVNDFAVFNRNELIYSKIDLPNESKNMLIFVTGGGERLRDLRTKPESAAGIILIDENAKGFYQVWDGLEGAVFKPTMELPTHLQIHIENVKKKNFERAVLHTHPTELIAITHHPKFSTEEKLLNNALWSMLPEVRVFIPKGISLVQYSLPGSRELADKTIEGFKSRDVVIWSKHGAVACGKDMIEAFDFIDVANKGAHIYLACLKAGYTPEGLSKEQLKDLEQLF